MPRAYVAPVLANDAYPQGNFVLRLGAREIVERTLPGQFVMVGSVDEQSFPSPLLKRALAVYTTTTPPEGEASFTVLVKVIGDGSRKLARLRAGDRVEIVGPLGNGFNTAPAKGKTTLLVVGGTGIASVYLLARHLLARRERVVLVYGGRSSPDLVGLDQFNALGLPIRVSTEDGTLGLKGMVTEALEMELGDHSPGSVMVYTCGPSAMMRAVSRIALKRGLPCEISVESRMACGFGVCLGCTVKTTEGYRLSCTHGPVFNAGSFLWEEG